MKFFAQVFDRNIEPVMTLDADTPDDALDQVQWWARLNGRVGHRISVVVWTNDAYAHRWMGEVT